MDRIFITGINTEVGKTIASAIMVEALKSDYWKPIQCGELECTDKMKVESLVSNSYSQFYAETYSLQVPQSPHYAAELEGKYLKLNDFHFPETKNTLIVEGAGGICVPLNESDFLIDSFDKNDPIILVSKNELGSINTTLLSIYYLQNEGFSKVGVLFNGDDRPSTQNIVVERTNVYPLGRIEWTSKVDKNFILKQSKKLKTKVEKFIQGS